MPGFEVIAWNALYAPKGTPKAIMQLLNAEMQKILAQPETRQKLLSLGLRARRRHAGAAGRVRPRRAPQVGTDHHDRGHQG